MNSLTFDTPDARNRLDHMAQGVIGKPLPRPDGPLKVSGAATYAAEYTAEGCLDGVLVTATIVKGRVTRLDEAGALAMDGVVAVITDPRLTTRSAQGTAGEAPAQHLPQVDYWGQPIALVVAETFEQARDAAKRLVVEYDADATPPVSPDDPAVEWKPKDAKTVRQGDLAHAMREAAHAVDVEITTAGHASAAMEPHATIAQWDAEARKLTVHSSLQMLNYNLPELADSLGLEEEQVHILAPYVGGASAPSSAFRPKAWRRALPPCNSAGRCAW